MSKITIKSVILVVLILMPLSILAKEGSLKDAEMLYEKGSFQKAADLVAPHARIKKGGRDAKTLLLYGKCLEGMTEDMNTEAERMCYRSPGAPRTPSCMRKFAEKYNARYGAGSFEYVHDIITIRYTGIHYDRLVNDFPNSDAAAEADYYILGKNLVGHPDVVLPQIKEFLKKHPRGKWHRKGLLLWARINEDIWWLHMNRPMAIAGWDVSRGEMIVKGEAYRREAMKAFRKVRGGKEGKAAKKELRLLRKHKTDGKMYGIIFESDVEGVSAEPGPKQYE